MIVSISRIFSTKITKKMIVQFPGFFSGYDKRLVDKVFDEFNPAIFCGLNTNFEGTVRTSDLEFKGYSTFIRNVSEGLGGLVVHINKNLDPSLSLELDSNRYEALWIEFNHPDFIRISDKLEKPKLILGKFILNFNLTLEIFWNFF